MTYKYNPFWQQRIRETVRHALNVHPRLTALRVDLRFPDVPAATDAAVISRFISRHRQQPCLPQRRLCSRHIQCIPVGKTATGQLLQQFTHRRLPHTLPHPSYSCRSEIPVPAGGSFSVPAAPAALYPVQPAAGNSVAGRPALSTPL